MESQPEVEVVVAYAPDCSGHSYSTQSSLVGLAPLKLEEEGEGKPPKRRVWYPPSLKAKIIRSKASKRERESESGIGMCLQNGGVENAGGWVIRKH